jgi:hypothetical protein
MKISVITPLSESGNPYVEGTYRSIVRAAEGYGGEWEWVVLENAGGRLPNLSFSYTRVLAGGDDIKGIGALKRRAFEAGKGDVLLELDHDDELAPGAFVHLARAFEQGADFVYSDFAEFQEDPDGKRTVAPDYPYGGAFGWSHYTTTIAGQEYVAMHAPPVTAHNLRLVDWAPNHVRAWTRQAYAAVGGHNPRLPVADDHELLIRTFLANKRMVHVGQCLYLYRVHAKNNVKTQNERIRRLTWENYERYLWPLAEKWCRDSKLRRVDLCGAFDAPEGYEILDQAVAPHPNLNWKWPLPDHSVGILRAHDAVEHLRDPVHTMNEAHRVLAPGGFFMIHVPSTNGLGAFCDPTHVSYWNKLSFRYYTDRQFARYVPAFAGRFQSMRVLEWMPSDWHKQENVSYVDADLVCLKPGYEPMGEVRI